MIFQHCCKLLFNLAIKWCEFNIYTSKARRSYELITKIQKEMSREEHGKSAGGLDGLREILDGRCSVVNVWTNP